MATTLTNVLLTNEFHRTSARVRVAVDRTGGQSTAELTASQARRAQRKLCGIDGCTCANSLGTRGPGNPLAMNNPDGSVSLLEVE